jgi:hypothetical protein
MESLAAAKAANDGTRSAGRRHADAFVELLDIALTGAELSSTGRGSTAARGDVPSR